ncbi:hypothetical protein TcasGA2_TC011331 [Tribolium castaneum]|uniref:Uncharacterized protein n=1 Tax=Tribolium castaneum TaxID=7070 RepID=D6X405_TRICA|nr:hypothetical protein TcasGA2_TC011331 [Tribolium castaneum]
MKRYNKKLKNWRYLIIEMIHFGYLPAVLPIKTIASEQSTRLGKFLKAHKMTCEMCSQKHYLYLQKTDLTPPDEDGEIYFDRFKQKHQHLKELLSKPLDTKLIFDQEILNEKSSEYQAEFCDREKKVLLYAKSKADQFRLSDNSEIPLTTQNASFKNPLSYTPRALDPPIRIIHPDNLGDNERRNELLQVKTGVSEYMGEYNTFGEFILEQSLKNHLAKK